MTNPPTFRRTADFIGTKQAGPLALASVLLLAGCQDKPSQAQAQVSTNPPTAATGEGGLVAVRNTVRPYPTDRWVGTWNGPEGTYLKIDGRRGSYRLTIANLDGPRTFTGRGKGRRVFFTRDGVAESLHATDGEATGMKWLADKTDCLMVRAGEGYCRD